MVRGNYEINLISMSFWDVKLWLIIKYWVFGYLLHYVLVTAKIFSLLILELYILWIGHIFHFPSELQYLMYNIIFSWTVLWFLPKLWQTPQS